MNKVLDVARKLSSSLAQGIDKIFIGYKSQLDPLTNLKYKYECVRCTYVRSLLAGASIGVGLEYSLEVVNRLLQWV
jgi:hypothetical protein